jgi:membrane protein required for colicin V production
MTWVDWAIVIVLVVSTLGGFSEGFLRASCSLLGLFFGLVLAAWNYGRVAGVLLPVVRVEDVADALGFLIIALLVMAIANIIGSTLSSTLHWMGLGCLDRLAGGVFGFLQGALLITICILAIVAFFPQAHWLVDARLPKFFFGICHLSTHVSPAELAERVRHGLLLLEERAPEWLHPQTGRV